MFFSSIPPCTKKLQGMKKVNAFLKKVEKNEKEREEREKSTFMTQLFQPI